jgi:hypothetical protein
MIICAQIITAIGTYYTASPCAKLLNIFGNESTLQALYPMCSDLNGQALVHANFNGTGAEVAAAMNMSFGMAGWLALTLHAFGVEVYVRLALSFAPSQASSG